MKTVFFVTFFSLLIGCSDNELYSQETIRVVSTQLTEEPEKDQQVLMRMLDDPLPQDEHQASLELYEEQESMSQEPRRYSGVLICNDGTELELPYEVMEAYDDYTVDEICALYPD
jgi:hypothetical protein